MGWGWLTDTEYDVELRRMRAEELREAINKSLEAESLAVKQAVANFGARGPASLMAYAMVAAIVDDRIDRLADRIEAATNVRP